MKVRNISTFLLALLLALPVVSFAAGAKAKAKIASLPAAKQSALAALRAERNTKIKALRAAAKQQGTSMDRKSRAANRSATRAQVMETRKLYRGKMAAIVQK